MTEATAITAAIASARNSMEDKTDASARYTLGCWISINRDNANGWRKIAIAAHTEAERANALENVGYWVQELSVWRAAAANLDNRIRRQAAA